MVWSYCASADRISAAPFSRSRSAATEARPMLTRSPVLSKPCAAFPTSSAELRWNFGCQRVGIGRYALGHRRGRPPRSNPHDVQPDARDTIVDRGHDLVPPVRVDLVLGQSELAPQESFVDRRSEEWRLCAPDGLPGTDLLENVDCGRREDDRDCRDDQQATPGRVRVELTRWLCPRGPVPAMFRGSADRFERGQRPLQRRLFPRLHHPPS